GRYFRKRGDVSRSALAFASVVAGYPKSPDIGEAQQELAEFKAKKVVIPDAPLPALVETLGRPSIATAPAPAAPGPAQKTAAAGRRSKSRPKRSSVWRRGSRSKLAPKGSTPATSPVRSRATPSSSTRPTTLRRSFS